MSIVERKIYKMRPGYLAQFDATVRQFAQHGGGADDEKYSGGRAFSNVYEMYTFAFFIGLYTNHSMDISPNDEMKDFWEIENWKPRPLTDQMIACALAESSFRMNEVELFEEVEVTAEVQKLRRTIEAYANGGLELIERAIQDNPDSVYSDDFFVKFLV